MSNILKFNNTKTEFFYHLFLSSDLVRTQSSKKQEEIVWFVLKWAIILIHFENY